MRSVGSLTKRAAAEAGHPAFLKVSVLITLERGAGAGGHVKCWERYAEAASDHPEKVDLSVHVLGDPPSVDHIAPNARFIAHRPRFGTRRLPFIENGAGHTDLASHHPEVYAALSGSDIVHMTDCFSMGRTASRYAYEAGCGLVASIHTDLPRFMRTYTDQILRRSLGPVGRRLGAPWGMPDFLSHRAEKTINRYLRRCDVLLVSKDEDEVAWSGALTTGWLGRLRRGIDIKLFSPSRRNRRWLAAKHGISDDVPVLFFAGRIDASKNVMVLANAARELADQGVNFHLMLAGSGNEMGGITALLGRRVSFLGHVSQELLADYYANADIFVFPSTTEVAPNAVLEAKASGLPVVGAAAHGAGQFVMNGIDGLTLKSLDPKLWALCVHSLIADQSRRHALGDAGRRWAETKWPSWATVFAEDLLPAWYSAASGWRYNEAKPAMVKRSVE